MSVLMSTPPIRRAREDTRTLGFKGLGSVVVVIDSEGAQVFTRRLSGRTSSFVLKSLKLDECIETKQSKQNLLHT
jgi:hypothetical protein